MDADAASLIRAICNKTPGVAVRRGRPQGTITHRDYFRASLFDALERNIMRLRPKLLDEDPNKVMPGIIRAYIAGYSSLLTMAPFAMFNGFAHVRSGSNSQGLVFYQVKTINQSIKRGRKNT